MNPGNGGNQKAEQIRKSNAELDDELLRLMAELSPEEVSLDAGSEWTPIENLGHIAEFPRYFARQLSQWLGGQRRVLGRVAEHSADRNDAIVSAPGRTLDELRQEAKDSFAELAAVLGKLRDEHLGRTTINVKYGEEPLSVFLDRYVLHHKAAHVRQLRDTIDRVRADNPLPSRRSLRKNSGAG